MRKPWFESYDPGISKTIPIPKNVTILDFFEDSVRKFPKRPAIIYFGKKTSYTTLNELVNRYAFALKNLGMREGDRIAIHLPNIPQFVICYLAVLKIGAVAVPIDPTYTGYDLAHILQNSKARIIITLSKFISAVENATKGTSIEHVFITNPKEHLPFFTKIRFTFFKERQEGHRVPKTPKKVSWLEGLMAKTPEKVRVPNFIPRGKLAILQYTGGTTGRPKGTMLAHKNLIANMLQIQSWFPYFKDGKETAAAVLPFFHIYALSTVLNVSLASGGTIVLFPQPDIEKLIKSIEKHHITILPGVPLLYEKILEYAKENPNLRKKLQSLKYCTSGAATLQYTTQYQFINLGGPTIIEGYGLTETSSATHINPVRRMKRTNSVGLPLPNTDVRIIDPDSGKILGPNEFGEITISGPQIMQGYWNDSQATNEILKDGWLSTGDIGYYDEDGYFFLVDRKKDMIEVKGSGLKVYPSEVEYCINKVPSAKEVVVVGKEVDGGGEVPVAYVVLHEHTEPSEEMKLSIIDACKKDLAPYKVPRTIEFVDEIPKSIIGKPLRRKFKKP